MTNTIYEVSLNADNAPVVTIRSSDPSAIEAGIAWARKTLEALKAQSKSKPQEPAKQPEEAPLCAVHKVPMVKVTGKRGEFWSCHQKNANGKWCSYRPITP